MFCKFPHNVNKVFWNWCNVILHWALSTVHAHVVTSLRLIKTWTVKWLNVFYAHQTSSRNRVVYDAQRINIPSSSGAVKHELTVKVFKGCQKCHLDREVWNICQSCPWNLWTSIVYYCCIWISHTRFAHWIVIYIIPLSRLLHWMSHKHVCIFGFLGILLTNAFPLRQLCVTNQEDGETALVLVLHRHEYREEVEG